MRTTPVENKERNKRRRAVNQSYLKAMDKNTHNHAARNAGRILKYGASGFRRNIWLSIAATLVMTITLLILCATAFASSVLSSTAQSMREKIDIAIYFKPGTDAETLEELKTIMAADSNVRNVTVSTSEAEYDNLVARLHYPPLDIGSQHQPQRIEPVARSHRIAATQVLAQQLLELRHIFAPDIPAALDYLGSDGLHLGHIGLIGPL